MSRFLLFSFVLVSLISVGFSQSYNNKEIVNDEKYFVGHNMSIPKYHSRIELESFSKTTLKNIYVRRVHILTELLPFMAIGATPKSTLESLNIPQKKKNKKALKRHYKEKTKYWEDTEEELNRIVNFSDTENIIEAIVLIESVIWQMQKFFSGDLRHEEVH